MKLIPFSVPANAEALKHPLYSHPEVQPQVRVVVDAPHLGMPDRSRPLGSGTPAERVAEVIKRWLDLYDSLGLLHGREVNLFLQNWGHRSPVIGMQGMFGHPDDVKLAATPAKHAPIFCMMGVDEWSNFADDIIEEMGDAVKCIHSAHFDIEIGPQGWQAVIKGWGRDAMEDERFREWENSLVPWGFGADHEAMQSAVSNEWDARNYRAMSEWSTICQRVMLTALDESIFDRLEVYRACSNYSNLVPHPEVMQYPDPNHPRIVCRGESAFVGILSAPVLYPPGERWLNGLKHTDECVEELMRSIITRLGASVVADRARGLVGGRGGGGGPVPWVAVMKGLIDGKRRYPEEVSVQTLAACRAFDVGTVNLWGDADPDRVLAMIEASKGVKP